MAEKVKNNTKPSLWEWVKAISTVIMVGVFSYKVYQTPITLTVDFPTLLSLLLALFSVALAALFYFKATDTSNTFYDNTYNFTKDIAQLLSKMESGFGEKLRNLDKSYTSMRDYMQNGSIHNSEIDGTKQQIADEKQELNKVIEERNKIVSNLLERSQLHQKEKEKIMRQLEEKEAELVSSQEELLRMNTRLMAERMKHDAHQKMEPGFVHFSRNFLVKPIGAEKVISMRPIRLRSKINDLLKDAPDGYIQDLKEYGYYNDGINQEGLSFIQKIATI